MKKLALVVMVALVLLPFAAPASAGESSTVAPAPTLEQQTNGPVAPVELFFPPIVQRCSAVQGTSCSPTGSTRACTDACNNHLSCTCTSTHVWRCSIEC